MHESLQSRKTQAIEKKTKQNLSSNFAWRGHPGHHNWEKYTINESF